MTLLSREVRQIARVQGGVVSRRQLLARGMTRDAIAAALAAGRLVRVHRGVYAVMDPALLGEDAWVRAALLSCDGRAVVSHGTAAYRWELVPAAPVTVELATGLEFTAPPGVTVHRTVLRPGDVRRHRGVRTTSVERTLLDLAVRYEARPLLRALQEAEYHHRRRPADILAVLRRGHPGSARLRAALERHVPGYGQMRSRLEREFRALLVRHAVDLPRRNLRVGPWTADCVWPELRVVVELDGGHHRLPGQAAIDAERDLWLRRNGWIVRRYTWKQVTGARSREVIADLRDAFAEARARPTVANFARSGGS